ncbi:Serine protease gd, partial [Gonioctena quinquepunctata]
LIPYQLNSTTTESPSETFTSSRPQRNNLPKVYNDFSPKGVDVISHNSAQSNAPYGTICGKPVATNSLIINGNEVPRGAYPWLAAIFGVRPTGLNYMCSASLISDRHVVTAAHCVKKDHKMLRPSELLIIIGKLNIQKWVPAEGEIMIETESIHIHPDYKDFTSDADVAVLTLSEKIQFTNFIRPLCLWGENSELEKIVGRQGTVVGWGKDENGILMTAEPKQTQLPIVGQETCLRSSYQFQYITSNRTFCAGFRNGSGPCNGDSGSGFILQQRGRWMLRGVVSMSISDNHSRTCDLSNYVVFTDASKFNDWFLSFIQ